MVIIVNEKIELFRCSAFGRTDRSNIFGEDGKEAHEPYLADESCESRSNCIRVCLTLYGIVFNNSETYSLRPKFWHIKHEL
jgi:hypothetical protein